MHRGKKYTGVATQVEAEKAYTPEEAFAFLQSHKMTKFDEAIEVHAHLGINTKKSDEMVRVTLILPQGTGRSKKVAVITSTKQKEAEEAKADLIGGEELIADIKNGKIVPGQDFDVLLATPEMMPKLALVAKILGQKGVMPSPKTETVTPKIKETVEMLKKGKKVSFKNDDTGNIHQVIGKTSFTPEALLENYTMFRETLDRSKPENMKGKFVKSLFLCSTMSPSLPIKL
ncbi:MAG: 50S ribosomal protein L1 [Candidatus Moranbacteria bacterium]|nr:50S ribosomal protein L1 [Candidatus Moranbacteria bacterium]MDD3965382.1 50S ribosomal protein L1 [Candidatus Moranbacteria bacterium]